MTTTKTEAEKAEAKLTKWFAAGMLDARCALPAPMADALARFVACGKVERVGAVNGFGGHYRMVR